ncbi:MAG: Wzz/FepE/Etk N-terminal domain-containing protein [Terracidiphilus sp.]
MPEQNDNLNAMLNRTRSVLVRRRWWIMITALIVSIGTILVAFSLPSHYRSEATLFVQKLRVPERYVTPNETVNPMEEFDSMTSDVLSSARLLRIINESNLYSSQRGKVEPNTLVALMRTNIELQPLNKNPERRSGSAFMIAFTADDPQVAQQVVTRLTSLFIEESQHTQEGHDAGMTNFLGSELEAAQEDLAQQESALRDYKMKNLGQLPEQQQGNLEILTGLQIQLQNAQANLARSRQQRVYLQAMLSQSVSTMSSGLVQPSARAAQIEALRAELARLRSERDNMLSRYSALYPDVVSLNQRIVDEEARLNRLLLAPEPPSGASHPAQPSAEALSDPGAVQLKSQLEANRIEIADAERESAGLEARIAGYRDRLNHAPVSEQQLAEIQRSYDMAKQNYTDLMSKKTESELATKLAKSQLDEQFQIIDPPSLPLQPSSPNRQAIAMGGLAAGVVIGVLFAFLIEARDRSFHSEKDVRGVYPLPLVVSIPTLRTSSEQRRLIWRMGFEWAMGSLMVIVMLAAQFYVLRKG